MCDHEQRRFACQTWLCEHWRLGCACSLPGAVCCSVQVCHQSTAVGKSWTSHGVTAGVLLFAWCMQALYNLGNLLLSINEWEEAIQLYDRLLAATPVGHWRACLFKASAHVSLGQLPAAQSALQLAAQQSGTPFVRCSSRRVAWRSLKLPSPRWDASIRECQLNGACYFKQIALETACNIWKAGCAAISRDAKH